jgi:excinuclease UvrABC nuclease subunit
MANLMCESHGAENTMLAAEEMAAYSTTNIDNNSEERRDTLTQNLDRLIAEMRAKMDAAAKSLDFQSAAKFRDEMYELQKIRDKAK